MTTGNEPLARTARQKGDRTMTQPKPQQQSLFTQEPPPPVVRPDDPPPVQPVSEHERQLRAWEDFIAGVR